MGDAIYVLIGSLALGLVGGLLGGLGLRWRINRRCTQLEWALGDVQHRMGSLHGRKASTARWDQAEAFEKEMAQLLPKGPPPRKRYDNDPLGEES